ncbi:MAG: 3-hydroxyacyl-ACP dehydratase FabZ [Alphaproteobacteria bacterium]|nr:3-hydroxyacyl-ACP dehydratase FabZ [Alphaproteobacteria bacterium]
MDIDLIPNVKDLLPHRDPFLFVDRMVEAEPSSYLKAKVKIRPDSDFFRGHFPGNPVTPGVIILEAMTQTMVLLSIISSTSSKRYQYYFVGADNFRIKGRVEPGDVINLHARELQHKGQFVRGLVDASVSSEIVATAELTFVRNPEVQNERSFDQRGN